MSKQVIHLDNEYTQRRNKIAEPAPRRKHLGFILVVAILLFSLASMSLIHSYQNLQTQVKLEHQTAQQQASLAKTVSMKQQEITKLQDPLYLQKFARGQEYSESDEKVFTTGDPLIDGIGVAP